MDEQAPVKIKGVKNVYHINESVTMVCIAIGYLYNLVGKPSRQTKETYRDMLVETVKHKKIPYQGPKQPGGYVFDRDSLWNDFFLAVPAFKKILEHRRIGSLDELELKALDWQAEHQRERIVSFDELQEKGIDPYQAEYPINGKKRHCDRNYED